MSEGIFYFQSTVVSRKKSSFPFIRENLCYSFALDYFHNHYIGKKLHQLYRRISAIKLGGK
jgi:hypothetical protein